MQIHEKRNSIPQSWRRSSKLHPTTQIPLRIALKQSNLHNAESYLLDVSSPHSPNYGKHWTPSQVAEAFAPSPSTISAVKNWLIENDIREERINISQSLNWLHLNVSVGEAEALLDAEYFEFVHVEGGVKHVACEAYSIPEDVREHVDFVTPTVHFDAKVGESRKGGKTRGVKEEKLKAKREKRGLESIGRPGVGSDAVKGADIKEGSVIGQLEQCDEFITLDCLKALYEFDNLGPMNEKSRFPLFVLVATILVSM